jgi:MFS family permease
MTTLIMTQLALTTTLAQTAPAPSSTGSETAVSTATELFEYVKTHLNILLQPGEVIDLLTGTTPMWAGIFVILGWICLVSGYRWRKYVVIALSILIGVGAGVVVGEEVGSSAVLATCLGALACVLAAAFMHIAVALFGAAIGAYIGATIWSAASPNTDLFWAGALVGMTCCGILAFVMSKTIVILFTSVGGATMMAFGTLAFMLHNEMWHDGIRTSLEGNPLLLPIIVGVCALISAIVQHGGGVMAVARTNVAEGGKKPATA